MAEYIDRDAVIVSLNELPVFTDGTGTMKYIERTCAKIRIGLIPIADVVERKRNAWIFMDIMDDGEKPGSAVIVCPNCGYELICGIDDIPKFCAECGTDMRGDNDGEISR